MRTADFDFDLPEGLIALRPASPRDAARLLVVRATDGGVRWTAPSRDLPGLLRAGDALVFNDTRVISARLTGHSPSGAAMSRGSRRRCTSELSPSSWSAFARPGKRLKVGDRSRHSVRWARRSPPSRDGGEVFSASTLRARTSTPRLRGRGPCRCRPTSRASAPRTSETRPTTRPSTPGSRCPSPRRRPAYISRPS